MKMSAYRQRTPMFEIEHGACISGATTEEDVELVEMALALEKPVPIGLDGQTTIIKMHKPRDDVHTFEALYDTAITLTDLKKVKQRGVKTPGEIPPEKFEVRIAVGISQAVIEIQATLAASSSGNLRKRLRDLLNEDALFRDRLFEKVAEGLRQQDVELGVTIRDSQRLDEPVGKEDHVWTFP
jgi:hypothetical protein